MGTHKKLFIQHNRFKPSTLITVFITIIAIIDAVAAAAAVDVIQT